MVSLHVLLARSAPQGVLIRLGPGRRAQLVRWDTAQDRFTDGQAVRGNVQPGLAGLSPDGEKLVYFARGIQAIGPVSSPSRLPYAFTAISRPPYFVPLVLWSAHASEPGGGHFADNRTLSLNHRPEEAVPLQAPRRMPVRARATRVGEEYDPLRSARLEASGWFSRWAGRSRNGESELWERPQPGSDTVLVRRILPLPFNAAGGPYVETFALRPGSRTEISLKASWADWDQSGRLVLVRGARLYEAALSGTEVEETLLADLTRAPKKDVEVPAWALGWDPEPEAAPQVARDRSAAAG
jgi:hypothetical protein